MKGWIKELINEWIHDLVRLKTALLNSSWLGMDEWMKGWIKGWINEWINE